MPPAHTAASVGAVGVRTCAECGVRTSAVGGGTWVRVGVPDQSWAARALDAGVARSRRHQAPPAGAPGLPAPSAAPSPSPWPRALPAPAPQPPRPPPPLSPRRPEPLWETGMTATPGERRGRPATAPSPARSVGPASVSRGGWVGGGARAPQRPGLGAQGEDRLVTENLGAGGGGKGRTRRVPGGSRCRRGLRGPRCPGRGGAG